MYYTGIDLHRKTSFFTTIDESAQVVTKANLPNDDIRIMAKNNLTAPASDLFGQKGLGFLEQASLPAYHRQQVETDLGLYQTIQAQVVSLTSVVHQQAKDSAAAKLLMTIPGVGPITAMTLITEIEDIGRFPSYRHLASYAGLVPALDASADKQRLGHITKQGSPALRTALLEAAQAATRTRSRLNAFFRRRIARAGYRKAIVATAHKIIQYAYFILRAQTPYRESPKAVAQPALRWGPLRVRP